MKQSSKIVWLLWVVWWVGCQSNQLELDKVRLVGKKVHGKATFTKGKLFSKPTYESVYLDFSHDLKTKLQVKGPVGAKIRIEGEDKTIQNKEGVVFELDFSSPEKSLSLLRSSMMVAVKAQWKANGDWTEDNLNFRLLVSYKERTLSLREGSFRLKPQEGTSKLLFPVSLHGFLSGSLDVQGKTYTKKLGQKPLEVFYDMGPAFWELPLKG